MTDTGVVETHRKPVPALALERTRRVLCLATVAVVLAACSSGPPKPKPTLLSGNLQATATVNPSVSKRPSPLLVRVYELKSATAFNGADFVALFQRDQAELGADIVNREEIMLNPGESRPLTRTLAPETRFLAVFAAYRDLERARWRAVVAIEPGTMNNVQLKADELAVSAEKSK